MQTGCVGIGGTSCRYRVSLTGSSPGIAASLRRPGSKLAAEQGDLAGVITVMRRKLPQHGMHGGLARSLWRADVFNFSLQLRRIRFRELGKPREQIGEATSRGPPRLGGCATLGGRIRVRRPAFDCFVRVRSILSRNFAEVVVHPIVHVLHDLPDGMRIGRYGPGCQLCRNIFDAGDWIHVGAFAKHEFAQCGVADTFHPFSRACNIWLSVETGLAPSQLPTNLGFVSGYRFSDTVNSSKSDAPLGAGHRHRRRGKPRLYGIKVISSPTRIVP